MTALLSIFVCLLPIISMWVIFQKAGKPGWAALVPIYNFITLLEIAKKPLWWIIMFCIPGVNIVFAFLLFDAIAKAFGKGTGFTVGLILLPGIFWLLLAFGGATYTEIKE